MPNLGMCMFKTYWIAMGACNEVSFDGTALTTQISLETNELESSVRESISNLIENTSTFLLTVER